MSIERKIFEQALEHDIQDARTTFLNQACGSDHELRQRVDSLLEEHLRGGSFVLDQNTVGETAKAAGGTDVGDMVGAYRLMEQIGEGGMGVVYVAEQKEPVRRRVALKIIKPGMDTLEVVNRFKAEQQALAMMEHPNIAKVMDAGTTEKGLPYFVMELVRGIPINRFCDQKNLTCNERLGLFMDVCHAIQHAHQKGVIHRDIKPGNVLVTMHDDKAVVKVIDFGVAKALHGPLADRTVYTRFEQMIGTPLYMSPEQAEMSGLDIDTRADIYALGVLLYELLTGETPFDRKRLREVAFDEMRRIIREEDPPTPSTRMQSLGNSADTASKQRGTDFRQLTLKLKGDLDWIVMKALEKDRKRRYETANGMALDIQRHLDNEPVLAGPQGNAYRVRKFVQRHKKTVVAASVIAASMIAGVIATSLALAWALQENERANNAVIVASNEKQNAINEANRARQLKETADDAAATAEKEKEEAISQGLRRKAMSDFLLRDLLLQASPERHNYDSGITVLQLLDLALENLETTNALKESPKAETDIRITIGEVLYLLGQYEKARLILESAVKISEETYGLHHQISLYAMNYLSLCLMDMGELEAAEKVMRRELDARAEFHGNDHPATLTIMNNFGNLLSRQGKDEESKKTHLENLTLRRKKFGDNHRFVFESLHNLGTVRAESLSAEQCEKYLREAYKGRKNHPEMGEDHYLTNMSRHAFGTCLGRLKKYDEAIPILKLAMETSMRISGPEHPDVYTSMNNMGLYQLNSGRLDDAEKTLTRCLEGRRRILRPNHSSIGSVVQSLAETFSAQKKYALAEPLFREAWEIQSTNFPADHFRATGSTYFYANCLMDLDRIDEAGELLKNAYTEAVAANPKANLKQLVPGMIRYHELKGDKQAAEKWRAKAQVDE